jgi:pantetheine-phosphate adenylyltransferase
MDDSDQTSFYPGNVSDNADKRIALFPGTFDPFTIGHESLVQRALGLVDEIVIAIGVNESKKTYFSLEQRLDMIGNLYQNEPRVKVGYYDCLTIDFAKKTGAKYILRGIRSVNDFEYEKTIADMNRALSGIETFVLFTEPALTHVSSTQVRELLRYGHDVSDFVPKGMKIKM